LVRPVRPALTGMTAGCTHAVVQPPMRRRPSETWQHRSAGRENVAMIITESDWFSSSSHNPHSPCRFSQMRHWPTRRWLRGAICPDLCRLGGLTQAPVVGVRHRCRCGCTALRDVDRHLLWVEVPRASHRNRAQAAGVRISMRWPLGSRKYVPRRPFSFR
jgi:hypothetical protein